MTKTHITVRRRVAAALLGGAVFYHEPFNWNLMGQSGAHTVADDLIDLVLNATNEAEAYERVIAYLLPEPDPHEYTNMGEFIDYILMEMTAEDCIALLRDAPIANVERSQLILSLEYRESELIAEHVFNPNG